MTYTFKWLQDHPYWTFDAAVGTPVDEFPSEWKRFWGIGEAECPEYLEPGEWEVANEMYDVGRRLVHVVSHFGEKGLPNELRTLPAFLATEAQSESMSRKEVATQLRKGLAPDQLATQFWSDLLYFLEWEEGETEARHKLLRTAVEIAAFPRFGCSPGTVATRIMDLLDFMVTTRGNAAREYLQRVAECYVRDMRPETAVMSRAVLEAVLRIDEIEERAAERLVQGGNRKRYPGLVDWIRAAFELGALDARGKQAAEAVKTAGDDAIHNVPQQAPEGRVVLENLRAVLNQIARFEKDKR